MATRKKKAPARKKATPKTWTPRRKQTAFKTIISRIEEGESVRAILVDKNLPSRDTFYKWLDADSELADRYARAAEVRQEMLFDEILNIADDSSEDTYIDNEGETRINHAAVQRSKLRIDARKWKLSKMAPEKYGNKVDVTSGNEPVSVPLVSFVGNDDNDNDEETTE